MPAPSIEQRLTTLRKKPLSLGRQPATPPLRLLGHTYKCSWAKLGNPRGPSAPSPGVSRKGKQAEAPPGSALSGDAEEAAPWLTLITRCYGVTVICLPE